jgi:hypothetical protein
LTRIEIIDTLFSLDNLIVSTTPTPPGTNCTLTVVDARGSSAPASGAHSYASGTAISARAQSPVTDGTMRYVCTGASVHGNAYTLGATTNVLMTLTNATTLVWQWTTNYWLTATSSGGGTVSGSGWYVPGAQVNLVATPATGCEFLGWSDGSQDMSRWVTVSSSGTVYVARFSSLTGASAITVTFDPPPLVNGSKGISSYTESSVSVYSVSLGKVSHTDSGCSALMPDNGTGYLGFLVGSDGYRIDMGGQLFTAKRIDLAEYSTVFTRPATVRFTGYKADGTTVSASFVTDGVIDGTGPAVDFQTFTFPSTFTDLTRIELLDIGFSLDNLIVSNTPTPPGTNCTLTVVDARGSSAPASGAHSYVSGTAVSARAQSPVTDGTVRYVCTGASVQGNAYTLGGSTNVLMTLTNATTLVWHWTTNYWLTATSSGGGTVSGSGWYVPGAQVNLIATPGEGYLFAGWNDGSQAASRWVTAAAPGDGYVAQFTPTFNLTVVDARGLSAPASGVHSYVSGTAVSANAQSPVTDGMIRYVCSGASVEGNAYTLDGTTNVLMTLTNATTLVWQWTTNYRLTATSSGNGTVSGSGWYVPGAQVNLVATPAAGCEFLGWSDGSQDMSRWVTVSAAGDQYTAQFAPQPVHVDATVTFDAIPHAHRMHAVSSYTENAVSLYTTGATHKAYTLRGGVAGGPDNGTGYFRFSSKTTGWRIDMGGQLFTAKQIDLAEYSVAYRRPSTVRFVGYKADGTTVSTSFALDGVIRVKGPVPDFQTFTFPATFADLTRVEIRSTLFSMDNLVLSQTFTNAPPSSLAISGASLASNPMPFALWAEQQGLAGPSEAVFSAINPKYGQPNGLVYAFQSQLKAGKPLLSIRYIEGRPVAETPQQDPATVAFVTVAVVGTTNLQDPDWRLAPVPQDIGSSVIWVNPVPLPQAFFKLHATLK